MGPLYVIDAWPYRQCVTAPWQAVLLRRDHVRVIVSPVGYCTGRLRERAQRQFIPASTVARFIGDPSSEDGVVVHRDDFSRQRARVADA